MIVYVDSEHERLRQHDPTQWERALARHLQIKYRLEDISGEPCLIVRYDRISPQFLRAVQARAVLVSGNWTLLEFYTDAQMAGLRAVFREAAWPTLGLCGGHQMLAHTYGAQVSPLGPLVSGDPQFPPELTFLPGMRQERGFMPIRLLQPHPLLDGLSPQPVVYQSHYWQVNAAPLGFRVLASSDLCQVQAIAHETKPLFGTQFHPELFADEHPDGRRILDNFFRLAGIS
ncbi:MAG: gamma-glutamyl-gamma-aminobutyrate hydrolase family protein [Chloroflexi bacterium]|nr:gamma-glutamyl-gamma-aminobutyrate hydrolase family protein [Chloroflexota bacterium]